MYYVHSWPRSAALTDTIEACSLLLFGDSTRLLGMCQQRADHANFDVTGSNRGEVTNFGAMTKRKQTVFLCLLDVLCGLCRLHISKWSGSSMLCHRSVCLV